MNRLFIVDPSLKDLRGHHFMMTHGATTSALEHNFSVYWFVSGDFEVARSDEIPDGATAIPCFDQTMYGNPTTKPQALADTSGRGPRTPIGWLYRKLAASQKKEKSSAPDYAIPFATALLEAFRKYEVSSADRVLFHTADGMIFRALEHVVRKLPQKDCPVFHVATPYDPMGTMPNRKSAQEVTDVIARLDRLDLLEKKVFLYGENEYLAQHLSALWLTFVRPLPVPATAAEQEVVEEARIFRKETLGVKEDELLVVSLGAARQEKGFDLTPAIIRSCYEELGRRGLSDQKVKFAIQASPQIIGRTALMAKVVDQLKAFDAPAIHVAEDHFSTTTYQYYLHAADCILMPYDEKAYRVRSSGIVTEALQAGKIIVAKSGSYPAVLANEFGGVVGRNGLEIGRRIAALVNELESNRVMVKNKSQVFQEINSKTDYIGICLNAETTKQSSLKN